MNNLFIDGSTDDSLFFDDNPGLFFDCEESIGDATVKCSRNAKSMGKQYAYEIKDDIFSISRSAATMEDTINREPQTGQASTAATIGFKNFDPMYENIREQEQEQAQEQGHSESVEQPHCIGRSADCGEWLTMSNDVAPYSANIGEYYLTDDDQAEHLSKMIGNRMRAELSTKSITSRIIEGRLTAVNENFLMIEQPDTGASIVYDINLFKYFLFLPETMGQEAKGRTNIHINNGIRKQNGGKNKYSNNTASNIQARRFNGTNTW